MVLILWTSRIIRLRLLLLLLLLVVLRILTEGCQLVHRYRPLLLTVGGRTVAGHSCLFQPSMAIELEEIRCNVNLGSSDAVEIVSIGVGQQVVLDCIVA